MLDGGTVEFQDGSLANFLTGASAVWGANSFLTVQAGGIATINNSALILGGTTTFAVGGSVDTDFNGVVDFNAAVDFDSTVTFDGATTFGANMTLNNSASMTVANSSGILVQGGASITWANGAVASLQDGATMNVASGAVVNVALGGAINVPGSVNFTSTGSATWASGTSAQWALGSTCVWYSGAITTFANVPTFSAGLTVSGGTTSITGTLTVPASATFSSTVLTSGAVNFSGTTTIFGAPNKLKCTARQVIRKLNLANVRFGIMYFDAGVGQSPIYIASDDQVLLKLNVGATNVGVSFAIELPQSSILTQIDIEIDPTSDASTAIDFLRGTTSVDAIAAPAPTGINTLTMSETINRTLNTYRLVISSTTVSTFKTCAINSITLYYTVSEYDEG